MKKFQAISIIICLIVLILAVSFLNVPSARAAVPYPVPHRSWIKLGLVAYQPSMTPAQIDWTAKNIDWFDNPHQDFLPQYKAKTNAPMLYYDNYYCLYIGQAKYNAMVNYATVHGLNLENMFLHFDVQTTVTFGTETHTLPAGSRVPTYSWYSTGGDLTKSGARVVMNVANPDYRNFNAEYELSLVNTNYGGATYDGIWVDNSGGTGFAGPGTITTGGTYLEYPGRSRNDAHIQYSNDMVLTFAAVRNVFGPKGASGSKIQVPNNGNYSNWAQLFPYIDGVFREFEINPKAVTSDSIQGLVQKMSEASTAGVPNIPSTSNTGITPTDMPREKMTALAIYYLAATPNDYFCKQDKNASDPQTTAWYGALDYNVGQPKASYSILATGLDPSSPLKDSGTGAVTNVGSFYKMTDSTKNWPIDYWQSFLKRQQG